MILLQGEEDGGVGERNASCQSGHPKGPAHGLAVVEDMRSGGDDSTPPCPQDSDVDLHVGPDLFRSLPCGEQTMDMFEDVPVKLPSHTQGMENAEGEGEVCMESRGEGSTQEEVEAMDVEVAEGDPQVVEVESSSSSEKRRRKLPKKRKALSPGGKGGKMGPSLRKRKNHKNKGRRSRSVSPHLPRKGSQASRTSSASTVAATSTSGGAAGRSEEDDELEQGEPVVYNQRGRPRRRSSDAALSAIALALNPHLVDDVCTSGSGGAGRSRKGDRGQGNQQTTLDQHLQQGATGSEQSPSEVDPQHKDEGKKKRVESGSMEALQELLLHHAELEKSLLLSRFQLSRLENDFGQQSDAQVFSSVARRRSARRRWDGGVLEVGVDEPAWQPSQRSPKELEERNRRRAAMDAIRKEALAAMKMRGADRGVVSSSTRKPSRGGASASPDSQPRSPRSTLSMPLSSQEESCWNAEDHSTSSSSEEDLVSFPDKDRCLRGVGGCCAVL